MATLVNSMIDEVHVMLVDHDKKNVIEMVIFLNLYEYKVNISKHVI